MKSTKFFICISRACLKKAFCKMCVTVCGRFFLNEGGVAGYVNRTKVKYAAKWGVQIAGMIFQTRSKIVLSSQLVISNFRQELGIHKFPKKNSRPVISSAGRLFLYFPVFIFLLISHDTVLPQTLLRRLYFRPLPAVRYTDTDRQRFLRLPHRFR